MKPKAALVVIGAIFAGALLIGIHRPFLRHREVVGAVYATMARNHVRLGYIETRLASYEVSAPDLGVYPNWRAYCYPNRPFLSILATSIWIQVLGDREWVLRLSLIAAALGAFVAFIKLAERLVAKLWVPVAAAFFAFNPMFWYFSVVAVHLVYALAFSLAAWACWVRWDEARRFRVMTFVFLFLACESDWPGYYATLAIAQDAFFQKRRGLAFCLFSVGLACFGLHVAHLALIDPKLVSKLLHAGSERSLEVFPSPFPFLFGEGREIGLYFTIGLVLLALIGLRGLPRRIWLLALLGLDELVFMRWAHVHDYLTYPLAPFVALAAVAGAERLWTTPVRRWAAAALMALAALQSLWITGTRLTQEGAYEVNYRAGLAIHEGTRNLDRVLITIADVRQYTPYYADRYTAGVEPGEPNLMIHPSGGREPVSKVEDLERYFGGYNVVLVGDPAAAATEIRFFKGKAPSEEFRFLDPSHPLRQKLESIAISKETRGAFVLYRLK